MGISQPFQDYFQVQGSFRAIREQFERTVGDFQSSRGPEQLQCRLRAMATLKNGKDKETKWLTVS